MLRWLVWNGASLAEMFTLVSQICPGVGLVLVFRGLVRLLLQDRGHSLALLARTPSWHQESWLAGGGMPLIWPWRDRERPQFCP